MKKLLFILSFILAGTLVFGQIDTLNVVGGGLPGGDSRKAAYEKINDAIIALDSIFYQDLIEADLTDTVPTLAELTAAIGAGPASVTGRFYIVKDTSTFVTYWNVLALDSVWAIDSLKLISQ